MHPTIDHREEVRPGKSIADFTIDGVPVFAFNVKPGDVQPWDSGNIGGNKKPNERAELSYAPAPDTEKFKSIYNVKEGMIQVYDVDYWIKLGFPPHVAARNEWGVLTQFHQQPNFKGIPGFGGVTFHDGHFTFDSPVGDGSYFAQVLMTPESWFKPSMEVGWASDSSGYVKITDRMTEELLGEYHGPTIAKGEFKYIKQGYYRAGGLPEGTVYQTWLDITDGPAVIVSPSARQDSVDPFRAAKLLESVRDELVKQTAAINAELSRGPYKP